jgi:ketosteroid isomerase-like protein
VKIAAMAVRSPEEMNAAFGEAVGSGDVERVLALYEPGALLAPRPARAHEGSTRSARPWRSFWHFGARCGHATSGAWRSASSALLRGEWHLEGTAADGSPVELSSRTAEVVRRQQDGSWLYVLDHAFGDDD